MYDSLYIDLFCRLCTRFSQFMLKDLCENLKVAKEMSNLFLHPK